MEKIKRSLLKRKKIGMFILLLVAILGYIIHIYYPFHPLLYVSRQWRMPLVYFLLAYKIVELGIFYFIFYHKPYQKLLESLFHTHYEEKFKINAKRFFFLVPQGSIVFGILSYKISGEIGYLWLFLAIAATVLLLVNPKNLKA
ncbi:MAG: hypothetical protein L3J43_03160 [Sulfurovum sp.]|nr:hypothetical protein [Sulfurovum sp.]